MKKISLSSLIVLVFSLSFFSSTLFAQETDSAVKANNQFAFELYSRYQSQSGNIFFSPYSISTALAITYEGANGQTASEIQSVFHFPTDTAIRRESFKKLYEQINQPGKSYELHTANALWAQEGYKFLDEYFNLINDYYSAKVTNLNFMNDAEKARQTINSWVEGQTNNKIRDLIPSGILNGLTRLVITNAVYFKASWLEQFKKENTEDKDFHVTADNVIKVPMMSLFGESFNYAGDQNLQVLEMPYRGNGLSMIILLPKSGDLSAVERSLDSSNVAGLISSLTNRMVTVYMPKFKFETGYFLSNDLKAMGMPLAFSEDSDFSGMTGEKGLFISEVIHKAFIDTNEEGTEAAAATAVVMMKGGEMIIEQEPVVFNADHPFIFLIRDNKTGAILFLGRVSNPKES